MKRRNKGENKLKREGIGKGWLKENKLRIVLKNWKIGLNILDSQRLGERRIQFKNSVGKLEYRIGYIGQAKAG